MHESDELTENPHSLPTISYPDDLPVSARRAEIAQAIKDHQVVIVCGETGSGKTTQLPKICLELGRGLQGKIIGHTQPRRLAATSVAKRIAQELQSEIGDWVGYQIRFNDKTGPRSAIKLMTDGILLAESQRDPLLSRYDTIIIDEAHERSLNIDFLLGFLKQLLPRRPDLKLIITSATIDADRFSQHFAHKGKNAPVIEVSGRLYPVDIVYRPIQDPSLVDTEDRRSASEEERDLMQGIVDAVQECARHGMGDILVFLPGEREIREATEALEKEKPINTVILPLFARLSQADQERIFRPKGNARRVVLATNVAETSLTVPGIRFVVDSGLARIKRYSWRNKVEQLRIEAISQASASQRAGRCGRIGPGICIRLYDEQDFKSRPPFTDPEILRSSLASVILRMKALHLEDVETFPFVEPPTGRAIADGYQILQELGALDEQQRLTKVGRSLAKLPVDPRVARMILAGNEHHCLTEMLIIASAMSVQDPRDRPVHEREVANQAHARFNDDKSEFLSYVKLWNWLEELTQEQSSQRKFANSVKQALLSPLRIREWRDVYTQLRSLVQEQRWVANPSAATYEQVHLALLTGLIGNIGYKSEETGVYQGTRELRFVIHPGSKLVKKAGRWILAGELMETTRLFARCVARIEPLWIEKVGAHLLRKTWGDPRWEKKAGQVVANERATLYGLLIYSGRRIHFGRIDPVQARELFLRQALVPGEIDSNLPFLRHNRQQIQAVERLEHQSRRPDILVDEELIYAFYEQRIPQDVYQTATLEKWFKGLSKEEAKGLELNRDELMQHDAAGITTEVFPRSVEWQGVKMALDYHFEPGSVRDGVTLSVPLFALNQIEAARCEWLVPGMLKEKVLALLKSLPQRIRRHCVPLPDYAAAFHQRWFEKAADPGMSLLDAISQDMWEHVKQRPQRNDFKPETLATHLFMNFRVIDEHGRMLSGGRNLDQLKAEHGRQAQASFQQMAAGDEQVAQVLDHEQLTSWSFGELPELMEIKRKGRSFIGYPALIDKKTHCDLDVFDDPAQAQRHHRQGLRRLFRLALREQVRFLEKNITDLTRISMLYISLGTHEQLRDQIIDVALEQSCMMDPWPKNQAEFDARAHEGRSRLGLVAQEVARLAGQILTEWSAAQKKLAQIKAHPDALKDIQQQLNTLMPTMFLESNEYAQLAHMPRYLKAVQIRVDKLRADPARDQRLMQDMSVLLSKYQRAVAALKGATDRGLRDFRWMLEELRVSLFAQELRTPMPVSVKRLEKAWAALQR